MNSSLIYNYLDLGIVIYKLIDTTKSTVSSPVVKNYHVKNNFGRLDLFKRCMTIFRPCRYFLFDLRVTIIHKRFWTATALSVSIVSIR